MASSFTLLVLVVVACISSSSAQWQQQLQGDRSCSGNCKCSNDNYIPVCGTDGRQETTYRNRCQLQCAQKCNPGLSEKFEGVCAEPYRENNRGSKKIGGNSGSWGSPSQQYTPVRPTQRPYASTTTRRSSYPGYQPIQTTRRPNYPVQTTTRQSSYPGYQPFQTTRRPSYPVPTTTRRSSYPAYPEEPFPTTRRPLTYPNYPVSTTTRRSTIGYPAVQPPRQFYNSPSAQVGTAVPYTIPTTTSQPWWQNAQSQYSQSQQYNNPSSSSGRQGRDAYDDYSSY